MNGYLLLTQGNFFLTGNNIIANKWILYQTDERSYYYQKRDERSYRIWYVSLCINQSQHFVYPPVLRIHECV